jgi:4-amino-4-deoxy-L-arabinose transferase-like glycosyltransferase
MTTSIDQSPARAEIGGRWWWLLWALCLIVVGVFVIRLPGIVEPLGPDQGVYTTIGWAMSRGLALYRDMFEMKPPGIYVTYWLAFAAFGTNTGAMFWVDFLAAVLTAVLLFDLARRLVSLRFGAIVAVVFALGTMPAARHAYGGFLERAISETFISLFVTAAAWATAFVVGGAKNGWAIVAGLFVGISAVYKPMAVVYWPALVVWMWLVTDAARTRRFVVYSSMGAVVAPLVALIWMWTAGLMPAAWVALAEYNSAYLGVGDHNVFSILNQFAHEVWRRMKTDEVWAVGMLASGLAVLAWPWRRTRPGAAASLGVLWLAAALFAIVLNGPRMFQTYFMPSLVPLCLLAAWMIDQAFRRRSKVLAGLLVAFVGIMLIRSGSVRRVAAQTAWDTRHLFGGLGRQEYLELFQSRTTPRPFSAADNERLAEYIRSHTAPEERIFIFGMTAGAYFQSGRLPASRFLFVYPAVSNLVDRPEFRVETLAAELGHSAPRYIVLQRHNRDSFSGWRAADSFAAPPMVALLRRYTEETEIGGFVLYRLN